MSSAPDETDVPSTPPSEAPQLPPRTGPVVLVAGAMGVLAAGSFLAGLLVRSLRAERVSVLAVTAALLLVLKLGVDRMARWAAPSQGVVATSLSAAGLAPLFVVCALWAMSDPLVASSWRCGTPEMEALAGAPVLFFLSGSLGTLLSLGVLGGGRGEVFRPLIRGTALAATIAAGALVSLSVVRAARKPDIDLYIDSLPVMATLPPLGEAEMQESIRMKDEPPIPVHTDVIGDLAVYRACQVDHCGVAVGDAGGARTSVPQEQLRSFDKPTGAPISVRLDEAHHFIVLERPGRIAFGRRPYFPDPYSSMEVESALWPTVDIGVRDVADSASPPLGWIVCGCAGLLAACGLLFANALRSRRSRAVLAGAAGVLGENGWVHFEDGRAAARVDPGAGIATGPVLVLKDTAGPAAYRESDLLGASHLVAGTREEWAERAAARAADLHAWAIATAMLGTAPLLAATTAGLVV